MKNTYIVYAKRSPMGKIGGVLAPVRTDDLMGYLINDFRNWSSFDPLLIDDVLIGCSNQAGEDNRNVARMSLLLGGLPFEVPGGTINRLCGSSLDAAMDAWCRISNGLADCILVGGVESMSRGPYVISKANDSFDRNQKMWDSSFGWRFPNEKMKELFPLLGMGETAEEVAEKFNIKRDRQDEFAHASHQKAIKAINESRFKDEIVPITVQKNKKESYLVDTDECPRADSTLEKLQKLQPVFRKGGSVTAGNSSPMNDGSSLVLMVSEEFLKTHNLTPMVQVTGAGVRGVHPSTMGIGPVESTKVLCQRFNKKISDFDVIELNEAFSAQALSCIDLLKLDPTKINLNGGAIALGHPLGCSGTRLLTTLSHIMNKNKNLKQGLATMCIGVGQGVSLSVSNC